MPENQNIELMFLPIRLVFPVKESIITEAAAHDRY